MDIDKILKWLDEHQPLTVAYHGDNISLNTISDNMVSVIDMNETDKAYLAGFIDGDGSIGMCLRHTTNSLMPFLTFTNNKKKLLKEIEKMMDTKGVLWCRTRNKGHELDTYSLRIGKMKDLKKLMEDILPYIKRKKNQAKLMLEYCNSRLEHMMLPYTKREFEIREELVKLNKKGK